MGLVCFFGFSFSNALSATKEAMSSSLRLSIVKWRRLSRWPFSKEENVDLSLLVAILDGDGPDSRWLSSNRKVKIFCVVRLCMSLDYVCSCSDRKFFHFVVFILFDYVSQLLSATAQGLSLGGCPIVKR